MDSWKAFVDRGGANNSYPISNGLEIHCHGANFEGPASLKQQPTTIQSLSPGEALWLAGIMEAADRGMFRDKS